MQETEKNAQITKHFYLCPCCKHMLKISGTGVVKNVELDTAPTVFDPISGVVYSLVVDGIESSSSPICPGFPPAEQQPHEYAWPLFGEPHPIVHDEVSEKKSHQSDQCIIYANTDHRSK